jgi:fructokinase
MPHARFGPAVTQRTILVAGYALIDLVPGPGGTRAATGGSPFNVALALGRLGAAAAFIGAFGGDDHALALRRTLSDAGVDLASAIETDRPTPLVHVEPDASGSPRYRFALADSAFETPLIWPADWPSAADHLHVGSTTSLDAINGPGIAAALARARGRVSTSFDPNLRPALLGSREEVAQQVEERVRLAEIVKMSEEDLAWLHPDRPPESVAEEWAGLGPRLVVLTRGAGGASAWAGGARLDMAGRAVPVMDSVGAGDTFMAALLHAMMRDGALGAAPAPIALDRLRTWLTLATSAAAIVCTRAGCDPPTLAEVEAMVGT